MFAYVRCASNESHFWYARQAEFGWPWCEFYVTPDATRFVENTTTILQYPRYIGPKNIRIDNARALPDIVWF